VAEADLDLYDAYNADEIFITSTSLCLCPAVSLNGVRIGEEGRVWGPVTRRLADAYARLVDHDFVGQYLARYVEVHGGAGVLTATMAAHPRSSVDEQGAATGPPPAPTPARSATPAGSARGLLHQPSGH
jgi:hypothetical protein